MEKGDMVTYLFGKVWKEERGRLVGEERSEMEKE